MVEEVVNIGPDEPGIIDSDTETYHLSHDIHLVL